MPETLTKPQVAEEKVMRREFVLSKDLGSVIEDNFFRCVGTVLGEADRSGDVLMPRCIKQKVLSQYEDEGWFDLSHNWDGEPIGTVNSTRLDNNVLHIETEFHTDEFSQRMRKKVIERLERKKKVSVSIAFRPDYQTLKYFTSGDDLLKWASGAGFNLADFHPGISKLGYCRAILDINEIYEVSVCNVGMHRSARATEAKRDDQTPNQFEAHGASLTDELRSALGAVRRAAELLDLRTAKGGSLGEEAVAILAAIHAESSTLSEPKSTDLGIDLDEEFMKLQLSLLNQ
ncbi:MAG TPA: hypothetical protein VK171_01495 [Fimbriimonas sp.]|nr:hypothetical protein [Fimbriimonas sp.]